MLRTLEGGVACCFTVTIVDGLVMARSAFNHSVNYRSVMLFGQACRIDDPAEKRRQLELFTQRMYPGRWGELRPVTEQELKATTVLQMRIEEGAAKVRGGPPKDDADDYAWPVWAGVVPVRMVAERPVDDGRLVANIERPGYLDDLRAIGLTRP
jgi:nitroimidazol reductase NimA-like FMN-containing flavoprotein (pyridoxamine 5'-phosphate oxidase superfamily)